MKKKMFYYFILFNNFNSSINITKLLKLPNLQKWLKHIIVLWLKWILISPEIFYFWMTPKCTTQFKFKEVFESTPYVLNYIINFMLLNMKKFALQYAICSRARTYIDVSSCGFWVYRYLKVCFTNVNLLWMSLYQRCFKYYEKLWH